MAGDGETFDTIVLGAGVAGLAAGLAARKFGLSPLVIEKGPVVGGVSVHSYGLIWVGLNHLARAAGLDDNRDDVIAYLRFIGGGQTDEAKMLAYVDRSPEALEFFANAGIRFRLVRGLTDHYHGTAPGSRAEGRSVEVELIAGAELGQWRDKALTPHDVPAFVTAEEQVAWGGINNVANWDRDIVAARKANDMRGKGYGLVSRLLGACVEADVPIRLSAAVERLHVEDGCVRGVVMTDGSLLRARRGVILATGGYHANPLLASELEGLPGLVQEPSSLAPPTVTGDAIVLAGELGGVIRKVENNLKFQLAYTLAPEHPGELPVCVHAGIVELCSPHTIVVNRDGQRFADETFFQGMAPALRAYDAIRRHYINLPAWLIFDANYARAYSFANRPAGSPIPASVARAETLTELAGKLGVDPAGLKATATRFNNFTRAGRDEDFHRGENKWRLARSGRNGSLGAIETPPFYGVELHPTNSNSTGVLADALGRVLHQRRRPIPGLYVSGYAAAPTESGIGYQAGILLAASMTFSYLAVRHMAGLEAG